MGQFTYLALQIIEEILHLWRALVDGVEYQDLLPLLQQFLQSLLIQGVNQGPEYDLIGVVVLLRLHDEVQLGEIISFLSHSEQEVDRDLSILEKEIEALEMTLNNGDLPLGLQLILSQKVHHEVVEGESKLVHLVEAIEVEGIGKETVLQLTPHQGQLGFDIVTLGLLNEREKFKSLDGEERVVSDIAN